MPGDFETEKLKSGYPEFFGQASPEFIEFLFSEKTFSEITEVCRENGIREAGQIEKIAYRVFLALLDHIPKENFTEIIELGASVNHEAAEKISLEMNRRIFSKAPELIKGGISQERSPEPAVPKPSASPRAQPEKKPKIQIGKKPERAEADIYREPIE